MIEIPDESGIRVLIAERVSESPTRDFKRDALKLSDTRSKREFLKDVTALANSRGGVILYGVDEEPDTSVAKEVNPLPEWTDAARLQAQQALHSVTEPRLLAVRFVAIPVTGGFVWCVAVEPSLIGPHAIVSDNVRVFYHRVGTQNIPMDVLDLRRAFNSSASFSERVEAVRANRVDGTINGLLPFFLPINRARLLLQITPGGAWTGSPIVDPRRVRGIGGPLGCEPFTGSHKVRMNADGFFAWVSPAAGSGPAVQDYVQVFRDGRYELSISLEELVSDTIPALHLDRVDMLLVSAIAAGTGVLRLLGLPAAPLAISASLLFVKTMSYIPTGSSRVVGGSYFDRDHVLLPTIVLDDYPVDRPETATVVADLRDSLYQAVGLDGVPRWRSSE